jgi:hypothetical protein
MQPGTYVAIYLVTTIDRIVSVEVVDNQILPPPASMPSIQIDDDADVIRA